MNFNYNKLRLKKMIQTIYRSIGKKTEYHEIKHFYPTSEDTSQAQEIRRQASNQTKFKNGFR